MYLQQQKSLNSELCCWSGSGSFTQRAEWIDIDGRLSGTELVLGRVCVVVHGEWQPSRTACYTHWGKQKPATAATIKLWSRSNMWRLRCHKFCSWTGWNHLRPRVARFLSHQASAWYWSGENDWWILDWFNKSILIKNIRRLITNIQH